MEIVELRKLVDRPVSLSKESETVEFKENFHSKEEIGERISALSNSACLLKQPYAYFVFGIEDDTHDIKGTTFRSKQHMVGNEELEVWLLNRLNPRIDFQCFDFEYAEGINLALYKIPATENVPVKFLNISYIRINSSTRKLIDYPEKEKQIWKNELTERFLMNSSLKNLSMSDIPKYLSTETYFDLMHLPYPSTIENVVDRFKEENFISEYDGQYAITTYDDDNQGNSGNVKITCDNAGKRYITAEISDKQVSQYDNNGYLNALIFDGAEMYYDTEIKNYPIYLDYLVP
jgi:predicted HTH transcriptional regulator